MKKIYVLFLLATVALSSCGRNNYTCPVYSKKDSKDKSQAESYAHTGKAEKNKM